MYPLVDTQDQTTFWRKVLKTHRITSHKGQTYVNYTYLDKNEMTQNTQDRSTHKIYKHRIKSIYPNKQNSNILKQQTKVRSNKMRISQSTNPKLRVRQKIMNKSSNLNKFI